MGETLPRDDGEALAYGRRGGRGPGVVWLGGFKSDMTGSKARALDDWAAAHGHAFIRFDYFGHGVSSGNFREGTVTRWLADSLAVLDRLTEGPQILVGSSMGGWLAVLTALARPARIAGLVLIAPAIDFTQELLWASFSGDARRQILEQGEYLRPSLYDPDPYPITRTLIEDGKRHVLLGAPIGIRCPVRILQGMEDPDVPWRHALRLVERLGPDTQLTLLKDADHRLSKPHEIAAILAVLESMLAEHRS